MEHPCQSAIDEGPDPGSGPTDWVIEEVCLRATDTNIFEPETTAILLMPLSNSTSLIAPLDHHTLLQLPAISIHQPHPRIEAYAFASSPAHPIQSSSRGGQTAESPHYVVLWPSCFGARTRETLKQC